MRSAGERLRGAVGRGATSIDDGEKATGTGTARRPVRRECVLGRGGGPSAVGAGPGAYGVEARSGTGVCAGLFRGWRGLRNHLRAETNHQAPAKTSTTPTVMGA